MVAGKPQLWFPKGPALGQAKRQEENSPYGNLLGWMATESTNPLPEMLATLREANLGADDSTSVGESAVADKPAPVVPTTASADTYTRPLTYPTVAWLWGYLSPGEHFPANLANSRVSPAYSMHRSENGQWLLIESASSDGLMGWGTAAYTDIDRPLQPWYRRPRLSPTCVRP